MHGSQNIQKHPRKSSDKSKFRLLDSKHSERRKARALKRRIREGAYA